MLDGSIALTVDKSQVIVGSGDAAVVPPKMPHSVRVLGPAEFVVTDLPVGHDLPGVKQK